MAKGTPSLSNRPRILWVAPYFLPTHYGGAVQVYHQLLRQTKRIDSTVLSQRWGGNPAALEEFDQRSVSEFDYRMRRLERFELIFHKDSSFTGRILDATRFFLQIPAEWHKTIREMNPDLVICGATLAAGWLMARLSRPIPFVNYIHGEELATSGKSRLLRRFFFRKQIEAIRKADLNIAVSGYTVRKITELSGVAGDRILLLPNFVDTNRFTPPKDRERLRRQFGWHNRQIILTLSRLTARKGIDQAIRALAALRQQGKLDSSWLHVIAGSGEQEQELRDLANNLGAAPYTHFAGFVSNDLVASYYGAADIFLQPNRDLAGDTEGFGIVFLEASACGTPVIGGIAGGTADAIRDGVSGFRVDSENVDAISTAVLALTSNDDLRWQMSKAGIEMVQRDYQIDTAAAKFEESLLQVLSARKLC